MFVVEDIRKIVRFKHLFGYTHYVGKPGISIINKHCW